MSEYICIYITAKDEAQQRFPRPHVRSECQKYARNFRVHGIDVEDVKGIFDRYTFIRRSDRHGEVRYQIFGYVDGREVAVACALRAEQCRIISARRARRDERQKYYSGLAGRCPTGED
jgi:uncharacterized DUF497 family protein